MTGFGHRLTNKLTTSMFGVVGFWAFATPNFVYKGFFMFYFEFKQFGERLVVVFNGGFVGKAPNGQHFGKLEIVWFGNPYGNKPNSYLTTQECVQIVLEETMPNTGSEGEARWALKLAFKALLGTASAEETAQIACAYCNKILVEDAGQLIQPSGIEFAE